MKIKLFCGTVYFDRLRLYESRKTFQIVQKIFGLNRMLRNIATDSFILEEKEEIKKILVIRKEFLSLLNHEDYKETRPVYEDESTHWRFTSLFEGEQPLRQQEFNLAELAEIISLPHHCGITLFLIAKRLKCNKILEIGTGLGISASYFLQALATRDGFLDTIEGYEVYIHHHSKVFSHFPSNSYKIWHGNTQRVMPWLLKNRRYDLVFLDASHLASAVKFQIACAIFFLSSGGILLIDDIDWSDSMRALWQDIKNRNDIVYTAEICHKSLPRLGIALKV